MTIDIGFAFLNDEITLIDVPGHEKFIKNMMAGASGIDAGLLVIAADDGVMPQTREHLDILNIIGIKNLIIALNKIDISDDDWLELVKLDIMELISESNIPEAEIIPVSAINNTGIKELGNALIKLSQKQTSKTDRGVFRLPVDRVFTKHGFGTVITGTVESGQLKKGDEIEILPSEKRVKVRGLQSHSKPVDTVKIGDRAAINLQSLSKSEVDRGFQITSPGFFKTTTQFGAYFTLMKTSKHNLKQNQRVRIHLGTMEVMGRITLLSSSFISPGESVPVIISLESPFVAAMGDKFIVRQYSPVTTIGGGHVLDAHINGTWSQKKEYIKAINSKSDSIDFVQIISSQGMNPLDKKSIRFKFGKSDELLLTEFENRNEIQLLENRGHRWLVTHNQLKFCKDKIHDILQQYQQTHPYKQGAVLEEIYQKTGGNAEYIDYVLELMVQDNTIERTGEYWHTHGYKINLDHDQEKVYNLLLKKLNNEKFSSSSLSDLSNFVNQSAELTKKLLEVGEARGEIIRLTGTLLFTHQNFNLLKTDVVNFLKLKGSMSVSEFKDMAGTTRKYAVPLLEYFDKNRITFRDGNSRKLVS